MMTPLARFLAHATGPGRLRATLRRKTRAVRTYRRTFVSLHQVYAAIPRSVLGGDILGLLSGRLRAVLESKEAPVATPARGPAIRPGFASRSPVDRSNREPFLSPMLRGQGDRTQFDPVAATLGRYEQPLTAPPVPTLAIALPLRALRAVDDLGGTGPEFGWNPLFEDVAREPTEIDMIVG